MQLRILDLFIVFQQRVRELLFEKQVKFFPQRKAWAKKRREIIGLVKFENFLVNKHFATFHDEAHKEHRRIALGCIT